MDAVHIIRAVFNRACADAGIWLRRCLSHPEVKGLDSDRGGGDDDLAEACWEDPS